MTLPKYFPQCYGCIKYLGYSPLSAELYNPEEIALDEDAALEETEVGEDLSEDEHSDG